VGPEQDVGHKELELVATEPARIIISAFSNSRELVGEKSGLNDPYFRKYLLTKPGTMAHTCSLSYWGD
jgi:hypothetical protein